MKHSNCFSVTVSVHDDGTLAITESDIKGLIIEVDSYKELLFELLRIASRLLQSNHGLTDEQISESVLRLEFKPIASMNYQQEPTSFTSLPAVSWGNNELAGSLQYV